jgi:hypothetical protein
MRLRSSERADLETFFLAVKYMTEACTATTRRGVRCRVMARTGETTCSRHAVVSPQCPVCLSDMSMSASRTLECGHTFHTRCLDRWKRTSRTCPMCRVPFDQPAYKVRVSVQRIADNHVASESYTTSNISGVVNAFRIDPFVDPRFITDILFEIAGDESMSEVFNELGINLPSGPFVPEPVPNARRRT